MQRMTFQSCLRSTADVEKFIVYDTQELNCLVSYMILADLAFYF